MDGHTSVASANYIITIITESLNYVYSIDIKYLIKKSQKLIEMLFSFTKTHNSCSL